MSDLSRVYTLERAQGADIGTFGMTLATEGEASDGHILSVRGAKIPLKMPLLSSHMNDPSQVLGSVVHAMKSGRTLKATGLINMNGDGAMTEMRRGVAQLIHDGDLAAVSVRWDAIKSTPRMDLPQAHFAHSGKDEQNPAKRYGLFFEEWRGIEGSVVAVGADPGAIIGRADECSHDQARLFFRVMADHAQGDTPDIDPLPSRILRMDDLMERLEDALAMFEAHGEKLRLEPLTEVLAQEPEASVSPTPLHERLNSENVSAMILEIFGNYDADIQKKVREATRLLYGRTNNGT